MKNEQKGECIFILNSKKIKHYTKEFFKFFNVAIIGFSFIIAIILIKYKPVYSVSISGKSLGYVTNKETFEEQIKDNIASSSESKNVDTVNLKETPKYELKLADRPLPTNESQIINNLEENLEVTYKYFDIALNNETTTSVDTIEEAEELVNKVKEENSNSTEIDLSILEKYTQNEGEIKTAEIEVAKKAIQEKVNEKVAEEKKQEALEKMPTVNGIKLAIKPITGTITSRYGVSSNIRKSTHTGIDIATSTGTPIKVVADGTVTGANYNGSYGNLVKVDHGNGVETWYAHTSKMYVKVGQKVAAGDTIAAVGTTGNSTGPHLHFEIRINGKHVNPQNYLYK